MVVAEIHAHHDRRGSGTRANIDHFVIGPAGVFEDRKSRLVRVDTPAARKKRCQRDPGGTSRCIGRGERSGVEAIRVNVRIAMRHSARCRGRPRHGALSASRLRAIQIVVRACKAYERVAVVGCGTDEV